MVRAKRQTLILPRLSPILFFTAPKVPSDSVFYISWHTVYPSSLDYSQISNRALRGLYLTIIADSSLTPHTEVQATQFSNTGDSLNGSVHRKIDQNISTILA